VAFEYSSAIVRDPNPDGLDRLIAGHHRFMLRRYKPSAD
jgi:hypothetical protein